MDWNYDEPEEENKKRMSLSTKILLGIGACVILIIILLSLLLFNIQTTSFLVQVDDNLKEIGKDKLITKINNETYVNIEEFAKLVGYEYHKGEYKSFSIEENKCYVQGTNETASFYLEENKIYKLPVNKLEEEYSEYLIESTIKSHNDTFYIPLEAIPLAFNIFIEQSNNSFKIYTLDYLRTLYNAKVIEWGYNSIEEQSFENDKALLYGFLIVRKEDSLFKIIDLNNTKEIVPDRYDAIEFSENMQEFIVTNTSQRVGIVDLEGKTKIESLYQSISLLDKDSNLYIIEQDGKYGVVNDNNSVLIYPEYDSIGLKYDITSSERLILDKLIPVYSNNKWGAYDKSGNKVLELEYDDFGYTSNNVEVNDFKKVVEPVITIDKCNGVVVKKDDKYGLIDITGKELVPVQADAIYGVIDAENEDSKYFMLYNGQELNVIERLTSEGLIGSENKEQEEGLINNNTTITENIIENETDNITNDINNIE